MFRIFKWKRTLLGDNTIGGPPATLIGTKTSIDINSLIGSEPIRVDGTLRGNIHIEDSFTVGETGSVIGDIVSEDVIIAGKVIGNIISSGSVHIMGTAKIKGDVQAINITIDEGASINGKYTIGKPDKDFEFEPVSRFGIQEN